MTFLQNHIHFRCSYALLCAAPIQSLRIPLVSQLGHINHLRHDVPQLLGMHLNKISCFPFPVWSVIYQFLRAVIVLAISLLCSGSKRWWNIFDKNLWWMWETEKWRLEAKHILTSISRVFFLFHSFTQTGLVSYILPTLKMELADAELNLTCTPSKLSLLGFSNVECSTETGSVQPWPIDGNMRQPARDCEFMNKWILFYKRCGLDSGSFHI